MASFSNDTDRARLIVLLMIIGAMLATISVAAKGAANWTMVVAWLSAVVVFVLNWEDL